jgi:hypothetical protein
MELVLSYCNIRGCVVFYNPGTKKEGLHLRDFAKNKSRTLLYLRCQLMIYA